MRNHCNTIGLNQCLLALLLALLTTSLWANDTNTTCEDKETLLLNQRPVAICQSIFRSADSACGGNAVAVDFDSGSYDPDGDPLTFTVDPVGPYPLGTTNVELTITDGNGGKAICYPSILVKDETPPTVSCYSLLVALDANGMASISQSNVVDYANSTDNCSGITYSLSQSTFTCADRPNVAVIVTATDAAGYSSTCIANVGIRDNMFPCPDPPQASCQNLTLSANGNCEGFATALDFDNGSFDPDGDPLSYTVSPFGPYALGTTTVLFTVTDTDGDSDTCTATVTVNDVTPPAVVCQDITVQLDASGMAMISGPDVTLAASAADRFINSGQSLGSSSTQDARMADLNGDGFDDLYVANGATQGQADRVYLNDGTGNFIDTGVSLGNHFSVEVELADLNGDGDLDAFVAVTAGRNKVFFNDGNGNFTDSGQNLGFTTNNTQALAMGDLDNDGDIDAFVFNYFQYGQIYLNNGNGFFSSTFQIAGSFWPGGIELGYLDNDNYLDAYVSVASGPDLVFFNNGNGNFTNSGQSFPNTPSFDAVMRDFNGDTYVDVFVTDPNSANKLLLNDGTGNLTDSGQNIGGNAQSGNVEFADFDGNGTPDAFVGNTNSPDKIYLNDGLGNFTDSGVNIAGLTGDLRLSDVDGDGDTDVFLMKSGANQVWLNNGLSDNCGMPMVSLSQSSFSCTDVDQTIPVQVIVTDASGNGATCTSNVTVLDTDNPCPSPPTAVCQNLTLNADNNCEANPTAQAFDNGSSDPDGTALTFAVVPAGPYSLGTTAVIFTVTDASGESATCSATVTVTDATPPAVVCQDINVQLGPNGMVAIAGADVAPGLTDNCSISTVALSQSSFSCTDLGQTIVVEVIVTDVSGNGTTCTSNVTVKDTNNPCPQPPQAICQNLTLAANGNCEGFATALDFDNGSFDPNGDPLSYTVSSVGPYPLGTTTILFTVTDTDGDSDTCTATVTVNDVTPPAVVCLDITVQLDPSGMATISGPDVALAASAANRFINSGQSLGSSSTQDARMADLNGDGYDDLYVANGANQVQPDRVYLNDGTGNFIDTGISLGAPYSVEVELEDLDGDGDLDAFVAVTAGRNKVFFNDGNGNFTDSGQNLGFTTNNTVALAMGDLDNDGDIDAFVFNYFQYGQIYLNNGNGFFNSTYQITGSFAPGGVELGYLNNDNHLDAYVSVISGPDVVYYNNGNGSFFNSGQSFPNTPSYDAVMRDFNGDTYVDVFVTNNNNPNKLWLNDGTGNLTDSGQNIGGNAQSGNVEFADFDGNGTPDAFVGNTNSPDKIYLNDGLGNFTDSGVNIAGLTGDLRVSDVDGDGDTDVFLMKSGANQVWLNNGLSDNCGMPTVALSQSSFSCTDAGQTIPVQVIVTDASGNGATCTSNVTVLDTDNPCSSPPTAVCQNLTLNADNDCEANPTPQAFDNGSSDPDGTALTFAVLPAGPYSLGTTAVVLTVTDASGESATCSATVTVTDVTPPVVTCQDISVELDASGMAMITENDVLVPNVSTIQFTDSGQSLGNSHGGRVILADFDKDGDADAFVANLSNQPNTVWWNDGNGNFTNSGQLLGTGESHGLGTADLDNDGDLDVLVGNTSLEANVVYLNDGSGIFTATGQAWDALNSDEILLGDLDGDSDIDAVVINYYGSKVWFNDGNAFFTNSGQHLAPSYSYGADIGDLDGDNDLDIFVSSRLGQPDRVWLNDGNGTFTDSGQTLGASNSWDIALADVDADGDLDAYVAGYNVQADKVWLNDGNANFTDSGQNLGGSNSYCVAMSDVDNDGDIDAFVASGQQANKVWLNDGNGIFTDSGLSMGNNNTWGLAMADLDGDGDEDAFTANVGQGDRVWFNTSMVAVNNADNCGGITYNLSTTNFSCTDVGQTIPVSVVATDASGNSASCTSNVTILDNNNPCPPAPLALDIKLLLSGNYDQGTGLMSDILRTNGYLPSSQPYSGAPWNYAGTEMASAQVLAATGNDAVVDWVLVELRDKSSNTTIILQQAALLQADGDIIDTNGNILSLTLAADDYFIAIKHRNHLSVMTANSISLSATPTIVDFTSIATYGTAAQKTINGINALWSGDANNDGFVDANDRSVAWNQRNTSGYLLPDFNLDGNVDAADRSTAWNNRNKTVQLP